LIDQSAPPGLNRESKENTGIFFCQASRFCHARPSISHVSRLGKINDDRFSEAETLETTPPTTRTRPCRTGFQVEETRPERGSIPVFRRVQAVLALAWAVLYGPTPVALARGRLPAEHKTPSFSLNSFPVSVLSLSWPNDRLFTGSTKWPGKRRSISTPVAIRLGKSRTAGVLPAVLENEETLVCIAPLSGEQLVVAYENDLRKQQQPAHHLLSQLVPMLVPSLSW
jgi:hypothetical protein